MITPAAMIAGFRSRSGSRISSPMVDASSIPISALHITLKLAAIPHPVPATSGGETATPRLHATIAATSTNATLSAAPTPPMFWIHLPTRRPRMLRTVIRASHPNATDATNIRSSTRWAVAWPPPNARMPAI